MENNYAGFWRRVAANVIDTIVLMPAAILIAFGGPAPRNPVQFLLSLAVGWIYFAFQESSSYQATLGKRAMNIKVTNLNSQKISLTQATVRHFGKFLSQLILFIGFLMMLWTEKHQTLHDKMAGTLVLKR